MFLFPCFYMFSVFLTCFKPDDFMTYPFYFAAFAKHFGRLFFIMIRHVLQHLTHWYHLPAARDELRQTSICQVSAAPQVQRAEEATASSQHTGHNIIVLNLQERQAAVGIFLHSVQSVFEASWRVYISFKKGPSKYATLQQPHKMLQ